jgi:PKD repeat protein
VSGDKPFTVNFDSSASTGNIVSYAWTFEGTEGTDYQFVDATSATSANPHVQYLTRGIYDVELTVTGLGSSDTESKTDLVVVKEPAPAVTFTGTPTSGTSPLEVDFDATNTGGAVTSWTWEYKLASAGTWTVFATTEDATHTFTDGTYDIRVTATGPDYPDTETRTNYIVVGAQTIDVSVSPSTIDFGTYSASGDATDDATVSVDVTGGTAWTLEAAASNGGYMGTGSANLANPFQLSKDGSDYHLMTSAFPNFLTGTAGNDGSGTAYVKQTIQASDAPGIYSITLTFTGGFN